MVKNLPAMQETQVRLLGREDPLEKGMATHPSILAWRIPRTEEPGGYSPWDTRELDKTEPLVLPLSFTTIKMMLLRSPMTDVKMAVRADCVFLHVAFSLCLEKLLLTDYQWDSWPLDRCSALPF